MSRLERVAEQIKEEISGILAKKVNDPRIGFVSLTDVEISPDLKHAKVFVSIMGKDTAEQNRSLEGLKCAQRFIRGELGKVLKLRVVPEIRFVKDISLERGDRILQLLYQLRTEKKDEKRVCRRGKTA